MKRFAFPFFSVLMLGVCSLALASCGSAASDSASDRRMMALYDSIDVEMKRSEDYRAEKERRIDMLRDELARETDVERRKRITDRLISEFESYNSDSALHYVNANLASPAVARDDYAYLQTDTDRYFSTVSLAQLEKRLDGHGFFRVHRGYLVNLSMVEEIESVSGGTLLLMLNGVDEKIPVSRRRVSNLKKALGI